MDFGEVLTRAWRIVWKFKILWIFGIFASCGTHNGGSFNGGGSSGYETNGAPGSTPSLPPGFVNNMERLVSFFANPAVLAVFFSVIGILVLLTKNLGPILIIWLILLAAGIVAGILIALPVLIIVIPAVIAFIGSNLSFTPLIVAGLCLVAYIPVSLLANGILMAHIQSVWTLTYIRLTKPRQGAQVPIAVPNA